MKQLLFPMFGAAQGNQMAQRGLYQQQIGHSTFLGFIDKFRWMRIGCQVSLPLSFSLKR